MPLTFAPVAEPETTTDIVHDELHFYGQMQPPDVPPDPTGEDWRGPQGIPGDPGQDGTDGMDGTDGISITAGAGAPAGAPPSGTLYIDSVTGDLWQYT